MLLVHIDKPSLRARYAIEHVVSGMIGWEVSFVDLEEFRRSAGPKLIYGERPLLDDRSFHVQASGWLEERSIKPFEPPMAEVDGIPILFPTSTGHDLFAGTFYLISRYEEYVQHERDRHGRLASADHFVVRKGIEKIPIVDHWALRLADQLQKKFGELPSPRRTYQHVATVDIDNGLKYLGRPFWQQGGAAIRDLVKGSRTLAAERIAVLRGKRSDPFEDHTVLLKAARSGKIDRLIAFILVRGGGKFDHAADISHPAFARSIASLAAEADVGIHPSYESSSTESLIGIEKERSERITTVPITASRQHFLRWRLPDTLRALEQADLMEDHSLGFSDRPGFRAGTCTPFRWYDLQQERVSDLVLYPFATMDSAFYDQQHLRPKEAVARIMEMSDAVRAVNGTFISVWHDRFLSGHSEWKGWPEAFQHVIEAAAP